MATSTPWGRADGAKSYGRGIMFYTTPGHGGFHVSKALNTRMPDPLRQDSGWYEEDCEWAKVALAFPDRFDDAAKQSARETLRNYFPAAYEQFFKEPIAPRTSYARDLLDFVHRHEHDFVVTGAWGTWHPAVPTGFVGVCAKRHADGVERYFRVPATEYDQRTNVGFVIDETRHQITDPIV